MKKLTTLLVAIAVLVPFSVGAAQFRSGEDRLRVAETIHDNLYAAGGDVAVEGVVHGDAFVAGGQVTVASEVAEDLFVGGGNVRITSPVKGDLRVAGGNIQIESNVAGEVMVFGGSVEIREKSQVAGPVTAFGGSVIIDGTTGPVLAQVGNLEVGPNARIKGELKYTSAEDARVAEGAVIDGVVTKRTLPSHDVSKKGLAAVLIGGSLLSALIMLIMLLLFVYFLPAKSQLLAEDWKNTFGLNLLIGLIFLIVTPIIAVLLLVSVVGLPLGLGVMLLYPIVLFFGKLAGTLALGAWAQSLWDKKSGIKADWMAAIIGLVIMFVLGLVPILGGLAGFLVFLAGLGAVARYDWSLIQKMRQAKQL